MTESLRQAGFSRGDVEQLERSLPETTNLRAALQKLSSDQIEIVADLVDGFESRHEVIRWGQRTAIQTLGEVSGGWLSERCFSKLDMHVLLSSPARARWLPDDDEPVPMDRAEEMRRALAATEILPACSSALRRLRWSAVEYVSDDDDTLQPDPAEQNNPAMRPALSELSERQRWALDRCLDGFASVDALTAWSQRLVEASYAEMDRNLVTRITVEEPHTRELLVIGDGDRDGGPVFRESFAALYLLPAFASAASEVADRAGELAEQAQTEVKDKRL